MGIKLWITGGSGVEKLATDQNDDKRQGGTGPPDDCYWPLTVEPLDFVDLDEEVFTFLPDVRPSW